MYFIGLYMFYLTNVIKPAAIRKTLTAYFAFFVGKASVDIHRE